MRVAVEVCVTSVQEALAAERAGADTVELCTWLACGGVTPSIGLVHEVAHRISIPLRVLVRPSPDGFRHSPEENKVMLHDLAAIAAIGGIHGLVFGALDDAALPEPEFVQQAMNAINGRESTFHRAIDRSADPLVALDRCAALGVDRVLTSGGASLAMDGSARIAEMVKCAPSRMKIAAAGGINAQNVVQLVESTGVTEIHFAAQLAVGTEPDRVSMSSAHAPASFTTRPDEAKIEAVLNALTKAGLR